MLTQGWYTWYTNQVASRERGNEPR